MSVMSRGLSRRGRHTAPEGKAFARSQQTKIFSLNRLHIFGMPKGRCDCIKWCLQLVPAEVRRRDRCQVTHDLLLARISFWQYGDRKPMESFKWTVVWWNLCFKRKDVGDVQISGRAFAYQERSCIWNPGESGKPARVSRMCKTSFFVFFFTGHSHVYQHMKCVKRRQKGIERERMKNLPEKESKTQTAIKNSIYNKKSHTSRIILSTNVCLYTRKTAPSHSLTGWYKEQPLQYSQRKVSSNLVPEAGLVYRSHTHIQHTHTILITWTDFGHVLQKNLGSYLNKVKGPRTLPSANLLCEAEWLS